MKSGHKDGKSSFIKILNRRPMLWNYVAAWALLLVFAILICDKRLFYDMRYYWSYADNCFGAGMLWPNFSAFPYYFRGYLLPSIFGIVERVGIAIGIGDWWSFLLWNSAIWAVLVAWAFPTLLQVDPRTKRVRIGMCFFCALIALFWDAQLAKPLSDAPAMIFFIIAVALIVKIKNMVIVNVAGNLKVLVFSFLTGVLLYAAYNARTVYLYIAILSLAIFTVSLIRLVFAKGRIYLFCMLLTFAGILLTSLPQMQISAQATGTASPFINTPYEAGQNLEAVQLYFGLTCNRAEGYAQTNAYPYQMLNFENETGKQIQKLEDMSLECFTIQKYIDLFYKYPMEIVSIYITHLVSYITPLWRHNLIESIFEDKYTIFILHAMLWIAGVGGWFCTKKTALCQYIKSNWPLVLCLVPCLLTIPGSVEVRFFLPAYCILYAFLCYKLDWARFYERLSKHKLASSLIICCILLVWMCIINNILSNCVGRGDASHELPMFWVRWKTMVSRLFDIIGYFVILVTALLCMRYTYEKQLELKHCKRTLQRCMYGGLILTALIGMIWLTPRWPQTKQNVKGFLPIDLVYAEKEVVLNEQNIDVPASTEICVPALFQVPIRANGVYKVEAEFDFTPGESQPELLYFDFYGNNYDNVEQNLPVIIGWPLVAIVHVGDAPKPTYFRIISKDSNAHLISSLRVTEVIER